MDSRVEFSSGFLSSEFHAPAKVHFATLKKALFSDPLAKVQVNFRILAEFVHFPRLHLHFCNSPSKNRPLSTNSNVLLQVVRHCLILHIIHRTAHRSCAPSPLTAPFIANHIRFLSLYRSVDLERICLNPRATPQTTPNMPPLMLSQRTLQSRDRQANC